MGLDVHIAANNYKDLYLADTIDRFHLHSLSREFCNFMCRQNVVDGEPELDQIGRLTGVDITPLYDMEKYWPDYYIKEQLSFIENEEEEREQFLKRVQSDNQKIEGNIDIVLATINSLINSLTQIYNLHELLDPGSWRSLDYDYYFTDFNTDKGQGYIGNNFGHDLRNFRRFLEFAKAKGTTTVWFDYG